MNYHEKTKCVRWNDQLYLIYLLADKVETCRIDGSHSALWIRWSHLNFPDRRDSPYVEIQPLSFVFPAITEG